MKFESTTLFNTDSFSNTTVVQKLLEAAKVDEPVRF